MFRRAQLGKKTLRGLQYISSFKQDTDFSFLSADLALNSSALIAATVWQLIVQNSHRTQFAEIYGTYQIFRLFGSHLRPIVPDRQAIVKTFRQN